MGSRVVRPETVRINISDGDWIDVKKRLNAGEARRVYTRMVKTAEAGKPFELDPFQVGRSQVMAYLVNWSFTDQPITGEFGQPASPEVIGEALDNLDLESFNEIAQAVAAHETAMNAERDAEKKVKSSETASAPTSESAA
jgi:hypothetical protein